jgi:sialic acid synthase SpsE/mannose-6-phosphate isomerase-like protein (cupin superfamily)
MRNPFSFQDLFIYDLANNHQGDFVHASRIVREVGQANAKAGVRGALKFQFRQLETFIHPDFQKRTDHKYVKRFSETRFTMEQFAALVPVVKEAGMLTMSTPFDEESVEVICDMNLDIIKIASCSADDRPLIEKIARVNKPVVVSTAGLRIDDIDWLVNYLESERVNFSLMHCVALYPTPDEDLQLDQIRQLKNRYRGVDVGWSTHESPDNLDAVQIAYALGARLFERHVGIATEEYKLNAYSSTPKQITKWLGAFHRARAMIGAPERAPARPDERQTLFELKRGVFARQPVSKGQPLAQADVFFAMPWSEGGMTSGVFRSGMRADRDYAANEALGSTMLPHNTSDDQLAYQIMLQVRGQLNTAGISINDGAAIEISHHFGLHRFREFGAVIITCINREYAKKLVILLPRQKHPYHYHKVKEETFQLLSGDLEVVKEGHRHVLEPGDTLLVKPGEWHKFHTLEGCVFEEISSTSYPTDSFYEDPRIAGLPRDQRKTQVDQWLTYFRDRHSL